MRLLTCLQYLNNIKVEGACTALLYEVFLIKECKHNFYHSTKAKMKIHVLSPLYEALIYRIVSITSVLSDIHGGSSSIVPWYLSKDYIEFQSSSVQARNCPEQCPQMAGLPLN